MIETERLLLRPHTLADYDSLHLLNSDAETLYYITRGKPVSAEEVWVKLLRNIGHWSLFGYGLFAVFERASGDYAGDTGLADFHRGLGEDFDPYPEAAWSFSKAFQGKGYAFEAAKAAHAWLAETSNPARTVCIIDKDNESSIRLAAKLGYQPFGETTYKDTIVIKFEKTAF